jgi:hypothetical protein
MMYPTKKYPMADLITTKIWLFDIYTRNWTEIPNSEGVFRAYFGLAIFLNQLYFFGGGYEDISGVKVCYNIQYTMHPNHFI